MATSTQVGPTTRLQTPGGTVRVETYDRVGIDLLYGTTIRTLAACRLSGGVDQSTRYDLQIRRHIVFPGERV